MTPGVKPRLRLEALLSAPTQCPQRPTTRYLPEYSYVAPVCESTTPAVAVRVSIELSTLAVSAYNLMKAGANKKQETSSNGSELPERR